MCNKVYEPGEMLYNAVHGLYQWDRINHKNEWALAEQRFFNLLSQQCKKDEQTDDNPGVPVNAYTPY